MGNKFTSKKKKKKAAQSHDDKLRKSVVQLQKKTATKAKTLPDVTLEEVNNTPLKPSMIQEALDPAFILDDHSGLEEGTWVPREVADEAILAGYEDNDIVRVTEKYRILSMGTLELLFPAPSSKDAGTIAGWRKATANCHKFARSVAQHQWDPLDVPKSFEEHGEFAVKAAAFKAWYEANGFDECDTAAEADIALYLDKKLFSGLGGDTHAIVRTHDGRWWSKWGATQPYVSLLKTDMIVSKGSFGPDGTGYNWVAFMKLKEPVQQAVFRAEDFAAGYSSSDDDALHGGTYEDDGDDDEHRRHMARLRQQHDALLEENRALRAQVQRVAKLLDQGRSLC